MKEWIMIHKIKSLHDKGRGLSKKAILRELGISINTVRKYLAMEESSINAYLTNPGRHKTLGDYREFIIHQLQCFPKLSAVKVHRRLNERCLHLQVSARSVRRYVNKLKQSIATRQQRYYQPVLDMVPGEQCQVDPGELRGVLINGVDTTVYFVVFVLSYSRLMHVSISTRPIDTPIFIRMHDEAFRAFGGVTAECVYDQTKLVVLHEEYRELTLNNQFSEYATHAGFRIHACEGYDPESKGKVEAGVKYVKNNGLYGEVFSDWDDLVNHVSTWVDTVANQRLHSTTGEQPRQHYEDHERQAIRPYLTPDLGQPQPGLQTRKVDKTGLISYKSNKYSVPMQYQSGSIGISVEHCEIIIHDLETHEQVARHSVAQGRGKILKNRHHYRDLEATIKALEETLQHKLGQAHAEQLAKALKATYPRVYKDQLRAVTQLLSQYDPVPLCVINKCCQRQKVSATLLRDLLEVYERSPQNFDAHNPLAEPLIQTGALKAYGGLSSQGGAV